MRQLFQQLNVLYLALMGGQVLFAGVVYYLISSNSMDHEPSGSGIFRIIIPVVVLGAVAGAYFLNRSRLAQAADLPDLDAKAQHYRFLVILRSALMEGANLFAVIAAMMEMNLTYLLYFAVGLLAFIYFRPSLDEFCREYGVRREDI